MIALCTGMLLPLSDDRVTSHSILDFCILLRHATAVFEEERQKIGKTKKGVACSV